MSKNIGSNFDDFLKEESIESQVEAVAIKRALAFQAKEELNKKKLNKTQLAKLLHTSRSSLNRLLDPENTSITLNTMVKLARILGKKIHFSFVRNA